VIEQTTGMCWALRERTGRATHREGASGIPEHGSWVPRQRPLPGTSKRSALNASGRQAINPNVRQAPLPADHCPKLAALVMVTEVKKRGGSDVMGVNRFVSVNGSIAPKEVEISRHHLDLDDLF
jgi:hypothetical protein